MLFSVFFPLPPSGKFFCRRPCAPQNRKLLSITEPDSEISYAYKNNNMYLDVVMDGLETDMLDTSCRQPERDQLAEEELSV